MAWIRNGRPDFADAGVQRLAVGLVWGLLLLALDPLRGHGLIKSPSLLQFALLWPVLVTPFVLLAGLGQMRVRTLAVWAAIAAGLAVLLVWHDITRQAKTYVEPSPLLIPVSAVFFFGLHQLVAAGDEARRWIAPYEKLFNQAARQAVQLVLSLAMTGLFWAVLGLGAALFGLIGIKALGEIIGQPWFAYPATTLVFAVAVQVADFRGGLIDGLRTLALNLLAWLGPLLTLFCLGFLLFLPVTSLQPLWATKAATPILLSAALVLIVLINAAYQDGQREPPPATLLRLSARVAGVMLVPLVGLAAYATLLRVGQYGLTPDRVVALAIVLVAGLVAVGYFLAAVLPGAWMKRLGPANIGGLILGLAVLLALFTPLADPARLSVDSQVARLTKGLTAPERFDYAFLRNRSERYGREALAGLMQRKDRIGELAKASDQTEEAARPPQPAARTGFTAYPAGAVLPADFLSRDWSSSADGPPFCGPSNVCEAFQLDLDGDGTAEVLLLPDQAHSSVRVLQVYKRGPDGWRRAAEANASLEDTQVAALRLGAGSAAAPVMKDILIDGRRIGFTGLEPPPSRPAKPPPQFDDKGGPVRPAAF